MSQALLSYGSVSVRSGRDVSFLCVFLCPCSYREASEEDPWCSDGAMCEEEDDNLAMPSVEDDNRPVIEKVIRGGAACSGGGVGWHTVGVGWWVGWGWGGVQWGSMRWGEWRVVGWGGVGCICPECNVCCPVLCSCVLCAGCGYKKGLGWR